MTSTATASITTNLITTNNLINSDLNSDHSPLTPQLTSQPNNLNQFNSISNSNLSNSNSFQNHQNHQNQLHLLHHQNSIPSNNSLISNQSPNFINHQQQQQQQQQPAIKKINGFSTRNKASLSISTDSHQFISNHHLHHLNHLNQNHSNSQNQTLLDQNQTLLDQNQNSLDQNQQTNLISPSNHNQNIQSQSQSENRPSNPSSNQNQNHNHNHNQNQNQNQNHNQNQNQLNVNSIKSSNSSPSSASDSSASSTKNTTLDQSNNLSNQFISTNNSSSPKLNHNQLINTKISSLDHHPPSPIESHHSSDANSSSNINKLNSSQSNHFQPNLNPQNHQTINSQNPPHLIQKGTIGAGAFVYKIYNMLLDPSFQHLISFNPNGQSFTVNNVQDFSKTVLPKHFKHNNFSSFVRQLNMYGFHKVNKTPRGQRGNDNSASWEFVHPKFHRGRPDLLEQIRRKTLDNETNPQSNRKDHQHHHLSFNFQSQASPTATRFSLDSNSFLSNPLNHPPGSVQLIHSATKNFLPNPSHHHHLSPSSSKIEFHQSIPSPSQVNQQFHLSDHNLLANSLNSTPSNSFIESPHSHLHITNLNPPNNNFITTQDIKHEQPLPPQPPPPPPPPTLPPSPLQIPQSNHFAPSSSIYSINTSTPSCSINPLTSTSNFGMGDPNKLSSDSFEMNNTLKTELINRLQFVTSAYESLHHELYETRRKQDLLIHIAGQMHKTLQSLPNANVGYRFPFDELFVKPTRSESTPIFKITEHDQLNRVPNLIDQQNRSVGNSPCVSEFNHTIQTACSDGPYRPLSIDPVTFGALGNLSLASYPNSPVGGLSNDQYIHLPGSPQSAGYYGSIYDSSNRLSIPNPNSHIQTDPNGNNVPISPRTALSTALKTPLPPSPFLQPRHQNSLNILEIENHPTVNQSYNELASNYFPRDEIMTENNENETKKNNVKNFIDHHRSSYNVNEIKEGVEHDQKLMTYNLNHPILPNQINHPNLNLDIITMINNNSINHKGRKRPASHSMDLTSNLNNRKNS